MKVLVSAAVTCVLLLGGCHDSPSEPPSGGGGPAQGKKNVVLLRYKAGSESTEQREKGFLETLRRDYPDVHILVENEFAGTTEPEALDKAQQIFNRFGDKIDGIFAVCEPNAVAVLKAIEDAGLGGKVKFIAFDPSEGLVKAMQEGNVHGVVLQDPYKMGYTAVKTMVAHLDGQAVEKTISTGEYVATPENMNGKDENGADIHQLLHPKVFNDGDDAAPQTPQYTIAVIPKGTTHVFWKSIHAGAEEAAKELGNVDVLWQGALNEADTDGQISVVQNFISRKVSGICLAPNDSQGLIEAVRSAKQAGIPVVIFDSGLNDPPSYVSYVATDNYRGGVLAARRLAEVLGVKAADSQE
ncbi:MAG: substrate-binding domain-containing protein [Planctomycetia bacterium]|nr:substrate-binding domain-containing protein [Planctomycetia bacterium]